MKSYLLLIPLLLLVCQSTFAARVVQSHFFQPHDHAWKAVVQKADDGRMHIEMQLPSGKIVHGVLTSSGRVQRFWFEGVAPRDMHVTAEEQNILRTSLSKEGNKNIGQAPELVTFLDFIANFLPADELVRPFELAQDDDQEFLGFHSICESIGKERTASFTAGGRVEMSKSAVVGDPKSNCAGRCGFGCKGSRTQYTQECLAHDLCHRLTGDNLGVCAAEFWAATAGFMHAPNCL